MPGGAGPAAVGRGVRSRCGTGGSVKPLTDEQRGQVVKHLNLIAGFQRRHWRSIRDMGFSDRKFRELAEFALCRAVRSHDPKRGRLSAYAYEAFWSALRNEYGRLRTKTRSGDVLSKAIRLSKSGGVDTGPTSLSLVEARDLVRFLMRRLTPREHRIVHRRFWLGMTLEECGRDLRLTRERVRQIEAVALHRLSFARSVPNVRSAKSGSIRRRPPSGAKLRIRSEAA